MISRLLSSERTKWIFLIGVIAIGGGLTAKNVSSLPIECLQEGMLKNFVTSNDSASNYSMSSLLFPQKI